MLGSLPPCHHLLVSIRIGILLVHPQVRSLQASELDQPNSTAIEEVRMSDARNDTSRFVAVALRRVQLHEAFATGNQLERSAGCTDELKNLWINAEQYGALKATRNAMRRSRRDYMNVGGLRDLMLREKKN
jgi:hypothetical protein